MKKKIWLFCLLAICLPIAGCGTTSETEAVTTRQVETAAAEDSFAPEDIESFTFEGIEYTFPLDYAVLEDAGWKVSDFYEELLSDGDTDTVSLELVNENYPGVVMNVEMFGWLSEDKTLGSVEEFIREFEENGVWGIGIYPEDNSSEVLNYPEFSIKGVTFGSPADDVLRAFGSELYPTSDTEAGVYDYFTTEGEYSYSLNFELTEDAVSYINVSYSI